MAKMLYSDNLTESCEYLAIVAIDEFGHKFYLSEDTINDKVMFSQHPSKVLTNASLGIEVMKGLHVHVKYLLKKFRTRLSREKYPDVHVERVVEYYSSSIDNKHGREFIETYDYKSFCDAIKNKTQMQIESGLRKAKCSVSVFRNQFENRVNLTYIKHAKRYLKENFYSKQTE